MRTRGIIGTISRRAACGQGSLLAAAALSLGLLMAVGALRVSAQTATPAPEGAVEERTAGTRAIEDAAATALMRARARVATEVPENTPGAVDLRLVGVEGVPAQLIEGVTVKAFTRYVAHEGRLIGQVVAAGLEKDGRLEALEPAHFTAQFDLKRPRLEPENVVLIEGDRAALVAALERLAEAPGEAPETLVVEAESDEPARGSSGAGGQAPRNDEAARYSTPERVRVDEPVESVRVTAAGCPVRIDLSQAQAIQQSRTEQLEDGVVVEESPCTDSAERYPLQKSYSVCTDAVDLTVRTATARYVRFYTDGGGKRVDVSDCEPDADRVFAIVEDASQCAVFLDYDRLEAVPQSALVYLDESNREVQVRGCGASETDAPVPMTLETSLCTLRHDYAGGVSHQQGAYTYTLEGIAYQAGGCVDTGTAYAHETVVRNSLGGLICERAVDFGDGEVTLQSRERIVIDSVPHYVSECTPVAGGAVTLHSTTGGCDDPAAWTHDLSATQSYAEERFYYFENGAREYVTECQRSDVVFTHSHDTAGWQNHDGEGYAYALTRVSIEPPTGYYEVAAGVVLPGAQQMPYQLLGTVDRANGEVTYEDCDRWEDTDRIERWERPDETVYEKNIGPGEAQGPVYSCTVSEESRIIYAHTRVVHTAIWGARFCETSSCPSTYSELTFYNWPAGAHTFNNFAAKRSCAVGQVGQVLRSMDATHYEQRQTRTVTTFPDSTTSTTAWENQGSVVAAGGFSCGFNPPPPDLPG